MDLQLGSYFLEITEGGTVNSGGAYVNCSAFLKQKTFNNPTTHSRFYAYGLVKCFQSFTNCKVFIIHPFKLTENPTNENNDFNFQKCRGQSYDNVASMAGKYKAMQKILQDVKIRMQFSLIALDIPLTY